jgi:serine/threonine protein phosphatase PrpC
MRDSSRAVFAVFDGHGREGDLCAQFCRDMLVEKMGHHLKGRETEKEIRAG